MKAKMPKPTLIECPSCNATGFTDWKSIHRLCGRCNGRGWIFAPPWGRSVLGRIVKGDN